MATGRFERKFEVTQRNPVEALKLFAMILFEVIAEIRHEWKYRKEFEA